jgi:hypothetical protein
MTGDSSPTYDTSDIDRLDPQPGRVTLSTGTEVVIQPLKTRQFFKLLRIITHGGAGMIPQMRFSGDMDDQELAGQLIGLVIFAVPDAEDETIEFIQAMCLPAAFPTGDKKADEKALRALAMELNNPEIEDIITIIEAVLKRESSDLKSLGNRIAAMVKGAAAANQIELVEEAPTTEQPELELVTEATTASSESLEASPVPST